MQHTEQIKVAFERNAKAISLRPPGDGYAVPGEFVIARGEV